MSPPPATIPAGTDLPQSPIGSKAAIGQWGNSMIRIGAQPLFRDLVLRQALVRHGADHLPIAEISRMSSSDSSKSKMLLFSWSRSSFEVRGIADTFCCTSQRRQIWAAVLR